MYFRKLLASLMAVCLCFGLAGQFAWVKAAEREDYNNLAEFSVTTAVTNEDVGVWTFTSLDAVNGSTSPITNQMIAGGGFEPGILRTRMYVAQDSDNIIYVNNRSDIDGYDVFAQGLYDGGNAYVYRARNGKMELVRSSKVELYNCSGSWRMWNDKAVSGTQAHLGFLNINREQNYYFAVAAVDSEGNESPLSDWHAIYKKSGYTNDKADNSNAYTDILGKGIGGSLTTAPTGLVSNDAPDGKSAILSWQPVDGAAGYVVYKSNYSPQDQKGFNVVLHSDGTALKKNDLVILSKTFYEWSRNKYQSPRIYGSAKSLLSPMLMPVTNGNVNNTVWSDDTGRNFTWRLGEHTQVPFANAGETYMELTFGTKLTTGTAANFMVYNIDEGTKGKNNWYRALQPGHTYKVQFWAKSSDSDTKARIRFNSFLQNSFPSRTFDLTTDWKQYSAEYTFTEEMQKTEGITATILDLYEGNAGTVVSVDSFEMYDSTEEPYVWSQENVRAARDSGFSFYRCHTFIKTFQNAYNMKMLCSPAGAFNTSTAGSATLDTFLKNCRATGMQPWFQIEFTLDPDEWAGWVEYMCAEYDPTKGDTPETKPFAYLRVLAGQQKPWIDEFDELIFEISNETWNSTFAPITFISEMTDEETGYVYNPGETYGLFHQMIVDTLKKSPYWDKMAPKFTSALGGWKGNDWELNAAKWTPDADYLTRAEYNGGWDDGTILTDDQEGYFYTSVFGIQVATLSGKRFLEKAAQFNETRSLGTYEAGPGYPLPKNSLTAEEQIVHNSANNVQKSLTSAVSTFDAYLMQAAYYNYDTQNFFTFVRGRNYWSSHTDMKDGGQEHVPFRAMTMYNNYAPGDFLRVDEISAPKYDIPAYFKNPEDQWPARQEVKDAPMVAVYATKDQNKFSVFVLSRKLPNYPFEDDAGYTPVQLNLPFDKVHKINMRKMVGNYTDNNIYEDVVKIQEQTIEPSLFSRYFQLNQQTGASENGVEPCSIYLYDFYLDYEGLPQQPNISASASGDNLTINWDAVDNAKKYFIYQASDVDGTYTMIGSAGGNETGYTVASDEQLSDMYYKVRVFGENGYRDSVVIDGSGNKKTEEDQLGTPIESDPPPEIEIPSTTLLWEDFLFEDETAPEHDADLKDIRTGMPLGNGWRDTHITGISGVNIHDTGWKVSGTAKVVNANVNNSKSPLKYGKLKASGVFATAMNTSIYPDTTTSNASGIRRIIERDYGKVQNLALGAYSGGNSGKQPSWPPPVGGIDDTTLWYSNLMRSSATNLSGVRAYSAFFTDHNGNSEIFAVGHFPETQEGDARYWGVKYRNKDGGFSYQKTDKPVIKDEVVLLVIKFDFKRGADKVTIYLNPDESSLGGTAPTGATELTINIDPEVDFMTNGVGFANSSSSFDFDYGEVRFGSDYAGVTPTPMPSIKIFKEMLTSVSFDTTGISRNLMIYVLVFDVDSGALDSIIPIEHQLNAHEFGIKTLDLSGYNVRYWRGKRIKVLVWNRTFDMQPESDVFTYPSG